MNKNMRSIFEYLAKYEGFYMDQYRKSKNEDDTWIALKRFQEGIYAIIITKPSEEEKDESEARLFLQSLGCNYSLNKVIFDSKDYSGTSYSNTPKVIVDMQNKKISYCSEGLEYLANITMNSIVHPNNKKHKVKFKGNEVTGILIILNLLIFAISAFMSGDFIDIDSRTLLILGGKYGPLIYAGQYWRLVTCCFLHGGILHLACNMYSLYIIGPQVEQVFGKIKYIIIYILSGIGSSYLSYALAPRTLSIGASGAIFGLLGAILVFLIKERGRIRKGAISNIVSVIVINLFIGLSVSNVDNYGHIGGLIVGFLVSVILYTRQD